MVQLLIVGEGSYKYARKKVRMNLYVTGISWRQYEFMFRIDRKREKDDR